MNVALIGCCLVVAAVLNYGFDRASSINRVELDRSLTPLPAESERGQRVLNILLVGSDSSAGLGSDDPIQIGRQGERFGDVIIVAHLDERTGEAALLSFPRDLWVSIAGTSRDARINKAFELGGPSMLIETIETEFEIPINHYVNVDFAGFQGLVSAVGSVDVYFDAPARDWNTRAKPVPRSQTGFVMAEPGCQSLDPATALAYVRSRYYQTMNQEGEWVTDPSSDLGRIRRQQDFLRRLLQRAIDLGARNPFVLNDLIDAGLANVAIDQSLTPQQLLDLGAAYQSFEPHQLQTYSVPVVDEVIGQDQVLVAKSEALEPVLDVFRGASLADPATVPVTVVGSDEDWIVEDLRASGFPVKFEAGRAGSSPDIAFEEATVNELVVQHGPDGVHAANLVATALTKTVDRLAESMSIRIEPVPYLPARSIIVERTLSAPTSEPSAIEPADSAPATPESDEQVGTRATSAPPGLASTTSAPKTSLSATTQVTDVPTTARPAPVGSDNQTTSGSALAAPGQDLSGTSTSELADQSPDSQVEVPTTTCG